MKPCLPALLCASLSLLACEHEVTPSDLVRTRTLYGEFGASTDDSGETRVTARLLIGGANGEPYEEMRDGDVLVAKLGDQTKTMQLEDGAFRASFNEASDGSEVNIAFNRTADEAATRSAVTLADNLTPDVGGGEVRRGELVLHWEPFRRIGALRWAARGDCIEDSGGPLADEGIYTVPAEQFRVRSGHEGESCSVELTMTRIRDGEVDPALEQGGVFQSVRTRTISFTSLPSYEELGIEPPVETDAGSTTMGEGETDPTDGGTTSDGTTVDTSGEGGATGTESDAGGDSDAGDSDGTGGDSDTASSDTASSGTSDGDISDSDAGNVASDASTPLDAGSTATDAAAP
jgi:hypothetical protein